MTPKPTGTVTFLFTDIEGSTQRWEKFPGAMERAHKRHEQTIRDAVARHNGYAYKMIGDAFQIAFATARDALDSAIDAQRELHKENWGDIGAIRVRMALHTGVTEERGDDYIGPVLNRVARLMSVGHGGQILISDATEALVRDRLPEGVTLRDMGERRLKDLTRAEHVYQVVASDLSSDFPALRTLDTLPNNLPIQLTNFIGREHEIEKVKDLLSKTRLLTLTGSGGCGKTRLALQVAADLLDGSKDGVWFVELAPLADPELLPQVIVTALGLQDQSGRPPLDVLKDYLKEKNILFVLDNCEHLIEATARVADELLHSAPQSKILATSREALGIAGETAFRVPSLSLPDAKNLPPIETLSQYEAVRLFIDRALAVQPNFRVNNANAPALAQICHRLGGIPLAIELAAARVKSLKLEQIAARLDDRFRLLTGGSRTALPRQQTLRALIDWSYGLLSDQERILLRGSSVFVGGWTLEAAENVCAGEGIDPNDILDLLSRLVDKSLVTVDEGGESETARYRLLETIRQYAREKLLESGEGEAIRDRHLQFYLKLTEEAEPKVHGPDYLTLMKRFELEHDNLRAAIEWATERGKTESGLRLAGALRSFWRRGYLIEGRAFLEGLLALSGAHTRNSARAKALLVDGNLCYSLGDFDKARTQHEESLTIFRELSNQAGIGASLLELGKVAYVQKDFAAAKSNLESSMAISRELGIKWLVAESLHYLGHVMQGIGDNAQAHSLFVESVAEFRKLGNKLGLAFPLRDLGQEALRDGDHAKARSILEENLAVSTELGRNDLIGVMLIDLGYVDLAISNYVEARPRFEKSVSLLQELGDKRFTLECLEGLAGLEGLQGQTIRAGRLYGAAEGLRETLGIPLPSYRRADYDRVLVAVRAQSDKFAFNAAWAEGRAMTLEQAVEYALTEK